MSRAPDFAAAFIVIGVLSLVSTLFFVSLDYHVGAEVSGHQSLSALARASPAGGLIHGSLTSLPNGQTLTLADEADSLSSVNVGQGRREMCQSRAPFRRLWILATPGVRIPPLRQRVESDEFTRVPFNPSSLLGRVASQPPLQFPKVRRPIRFPRSGR
jgi:hypothetical protein